MPGEESMSARVKHLNGRLPSVVEDEIHRLMLVDYRIAALVLVPTAGDFSGPLKVAFSTRRFSDLTGYENAQVADRETDWLQGPETDAQALEDIRAAVVAGEEAETHLLSYTNAGDAFWVRVQAHPLKRRGGMNTRKRMMIVSDGRFRCPFRVLFPDGGKFCCCAYLLAPGVQRTSAWPF